MNKNNLNNYLKGLSTIAFLPMISIGMFIYFKKGISFFQDASLDDLSKLGDFYGGLLNPTFAFLAFIALLSTIKLQNDTLYQSKDEIELTRKELEKSAKAQEEQSKSLELQNEATRIQIFENTFFQLIELFIRTRKELVVDIQRNTYFEKIGLRSIGDYPHYKVNGIEETIGSFGYSYKEYSGNDVFNIYCSILKRCYEDYNSFNDNYEAFTGSYFGQIYHILNFVNESYIENKQRYISIFRSQFNKKELEFLFYHCLGKIGKRKFKGLLEKYEFFEHTTHIENKDEISKLLSEYEISAYGKNESLRKMHKDYKNKEKDKHWKEDFDE